MVESIHAEVRALTSLPVDLDKIQTSVHDTVKLTVMYAYMKKSTA